MRLHATMLSGLCAGLFTWQDDPHSYNNTCIRTGAKEGLKRGFLYQKKPVTSINTRGLKGGLPMAAKKRLKTMSDLRKYLANLINQTKDGQVEPALAGRLGFLLNVLKGVISDGELENRIKKLEEVAKNESEK